MIELGRFSVCGVPIDAVDYEMSVSRIMSAAGNRIPYCVSALAVHGVMTGVLDREHLARLQSFDLIVPDGQPVRWAMNLLHKQNLKKRVYGPELTLRLLERAETDGTRVYFYGSRPTVLGRLLANVRNKFPDLTIAGSQPSQFKCLTDEENQMMIQDIKDTGAQIVFIGLGCPRQEVWAFENAAKLQMPVIAVGAAFDFHAGTLSQAPPFMQDRGLEWLYRLYKEPRRLWRRYVYLNPLFCLSVAKQWCMPKSMQTDHPITPRPVRYG